MGDDLEVLYETLTRRVLERCPACGEANWAKAEIVVVLLERVDTDQPAPKGKGLPALPMVCHYCGYIRLHSVALLEKHQGQA